ncbi:peptidoglycan-binding domain-containing protein [uncultured Nonlabens sp.]|uniref:peptidoglycan-binding domain-containing protein n=1 Tax=uncultured Nonlabens sp. TaxID=859306 RepID=UPI00263893B7|nr:peptidoglycan-binding domain-containing protein [uncultured Nonlabens sp.]
MKIRVFTQFTQLGNPVSITAYSSDRILSFRRLRIVAAIKFSRKNLKKGDSGNEVILLQDTLKQLGHDCGTSNGMFGPKTESALKQFQSTDRSM